MSFILDALKKSEIERQRQSTPGLVESGIPRPRSALPIWAIALGILLAVNLLVLAVVLIHGLPSKPPLTVPRSVARRPSGENSAAHTDGQFSPLNGSPEYAPEIPLATVPENAAATAAPAYAAPRQAAISSSPPKQANSGSSGPRTVRRQDPLLTGEDYKSNDDEVLPTINEMNLKGAQALPDLHLDVHVFATQPAERFVYVNMRKYHEGAQLQEGPTVERIRRDGVILSYQGLRFLLPRQ